MTEAWTYLISNAREGQYSGNSVLMKQFSKEVSSLVKTRSRMFSPLTKARVLPNGGEPYPQHHQRLVTQALKFSLKAPRILFKPDKNINLKNIYCNHLF